MIRCPRPLLAALVPATLLLGPSGPSRASIPIDGDAGDRIPTLPRITVVGKPVQEGSTEAGYRVETVTTTGAWGDRPLRDTPYTITVLPRELIENVMARGVDTLMRIAPLVQAGQSQDLNGIAQATIRGFNVARVYVNGIQNDNLGMGVFAEEIERLEIVSGLTGFLYGASPVGGLINYQLKRPTGTEQRRLTVGNYGGRQFFGHADIGGPVGDDSGLGYRLNVLYQDGDTVVDDQQLRRAMVSGSVDWQPQDSLSLRLNASSKDYRLDGRQFQFFLGGDVPAPLDGTKLYAPRDTFVDIDTDEVHAAMDYAPDAAFKLRMAAQRKKDARAMVYGIGSLLPGGTQYSMNLFGGKLDTLSEGGYAYLDTTFTTGRIAHALTLGVNGLRYRNRLAMLPHGTPFLFDGPYTLDLADGDAAGLAVPDWDLSVTRWIVNARSSNRNLVVGDDIRVGDRWSMLLGLNQSRIRSRSFDPFTGAAQPEYRYDRSATTPAASILYRASPSVTAYATYIESLEQGAIVGDTYANAGQILEPLTSRQYELGLKADVAAVQLAAALFRIERANELSDDGTLTGTYVQDGRVMHRGLELSATGRLTEELTLLSGLTFMDNEVTRSSDPAVEGRRPTWVAASTVKFHGEYAPRLLPRWTFSAGVQRHGRGYQDAANTRRLPGYTLADAGVRYQATVLGRTAIARLALTNLTDERYWAATSPGAPRTLAFSVTADF
jgi:iron complex outermembrane receptor protein